MKKILLLAVIALQGCSADSVKPGQKEQHFNYQSTQELVISRRCVSDNSRASKQIAKVKEEQMDVNVYRLTLTLTDKDNVVVVHIRSKGTGSTIDFDIEPPLPGVQKTLLDGLAASC